MHQSDKISAINSSPTHIAPSLSSSTSSSKIGTGSSAMISTSASSNCLESNDDDSTAVSVQSESVENIRPVHHSLLIPSIYTLNVYKNLLPIISHVQLLWELVITCEPLIVMAPTPDVCSQVVSSLVSLITPLKYSRDYRPFFTIHDSEFKEYTSKKQSP